MPVVLITGGASGIGACCVSRFLRAGWVISIVDLNGPSAPTTIGLHVQGDITREDVRQESVSRTLERFGRIDAVVHSAGIGLYRTAAQTSHDHLTKIFETNFVAPWRLSQMALPYLRRNGSGAIVNVGSVAGDVALPWAAAYSSSKAAIHHMMDAMRRELKREGIRVIDVRPGIVSTNFRERVLDGKPPSNVRKIRFVVSPEEVAERLYHSVTSGKSGTVYVPRIGRLFAILGTVSPKLMDRYLARVDGDTHPAADRTDASSDRTRGTGA